MTTTLIVTLTILVCALIAVLAVDRLEQRAARRDREIIRRIHTYMAKLPPSRPW